MSNRCLYCRPRGTQVELRAEGPKMESKVMLLDVKF